MPMTSSSIPLEAAAARAVDLLRRSRRVVLSGHVRPDGDCIGAQAALASVLEALGKEVWVLNPDPPEERYTYLSDRLRYGVYPDDPLPEHDLAVLLDISELSRTGELAPALAAAPSAKLVVDHHVPSSEAWWDEAFLDVTASATGILVHRIARELGVELDALAVDGLFTSIVTDTGWFKYSNTDAETLAVAAELVGRGVEPAKLFSAIYQRLPASEPRALGRLLERLTYHEGERLALVELAADDEVARQLKDSDGLLDVLRAVESVEAVLFLRELDDGRCKLSARSKSWYDVHALAKGFGGGGHVRAAGATLEGPLERAREGLLAAARAGFAGR
jgi:phosphoesterase RecJ-like protein